MKYKKTLIFLILFIVFLIHPEQKDQDADKIAQALRDRLTCPHIEVILKGHKPITLRIEEKNKKTQGGRWV